MASLGVFFTSFITGPLTWLLSFLRPLLDPFIGTKLPDVTESTDSSPAAPMSTFARRRLRRTSRPQSNGENSETPTASFPPASTPGSYKPAIIDVIKLRHYLIKASNQTIPIELIDEIIDYAEYWPHVSATKTHPLVARGETAHSDVLVIRTPPICSLATHNSHLNALGLPEPYRLRPARKVVFTIRSHDQGWSGEPRDTRGTYRNSYTWFDAQIDKQFRPIPHNAPLSRVPWELSSTLFLEKWPQHRHQVDDEEAAAEASATQANATEEVAEHAGPTTETRGETNIPQETEESSEQQQQQEAQQQEEAELNAVAAGQERNNPDNSAVDPAEETEARAFSHQYLQNNRYEVQYNVQARSATKEHCFEWSWTDRTPAEGPGADDLAAQGRGKSTGDGRFVRELKLGDCVSLWAKARHPQWANHVEGAKLEIYFAL